MINANAAYTFKSVDNYEVLPVQDGKMMERVFQSISNISDESAKTNAVILVKTNDLASNNSDSNENSYFAVPLKDSQSIQDLIDQYNQKEQNLIEKTELVINESPLALRD